MAVKKYVSGSGTICFPYNALRQVRTDRTNGGEKVFDKNEINF